MGGRGRERHRPRSITYSHKTTGKICYEVRRKTNGIGLVPAKVFDLGGDALIAELPPPLKPEVKATVTYSCGSAGVMKVIIQMGDTTAEVTIGSKTYLVLRKDHLVLRFSLAADDGAWLRPR